MSIDELVALGAEAELVGRLPVREREERDVRGHGAKRARIGDVDLHAAADFAARACGTSDGT